MNIRRNFFLQRAVLQRHRLPREVVQSLFLEVFKKCVNTVLSDFTGVVVMG